MEVLVYKYSHNALEARKVVNLSHITKGSPYQINDKKLHPLLDFIQPVYHSFYQELSGCAGDDSDFESDRSDSES